MIRLFAVLFLGLLLGGGGSTPLLGAEPEVPDGSEEARRTLAGLRVPPEIKVELFAAEPQLGGPVAICLDEQGKVYVAEEYRFNRGTEENRTRAFFLEEDLQVETLEDRLRMYERHAGRFDGGMAWFSRWADQVRMVEDRDGDGRADRSTIFAGGFNAPLDGLAAGVIARDGDIFFTCIPSLWRLRDTDGDGVADERESVHRGFGVNAAFLGHDLHGLCWGPDGKLYFSVGDRGYDVTTREGQRLHGPRQGAVFRCHPDGSQLEVVHRGLRNPQELAFDEFGNLFAADNNCDKGDHARLVYVVEEGESGWNMAYQTIPEPYLTGPWHAEKLWHLEHEGQAAYLVPPVGKLGAGPSGFAYYSHGALPERYRGRFFLCNYTGGGGIETFAVRPRGAGFELVDQQDFLKPVSATDVDFGYDGKMYVADFVQLIWDGGNRKGRIYTACEPQRARDLAVLAVRDLFRAGWQKPASDALAQLLAHGDQRVRQRAQFALAERAIAGEQRAWELLASAVAQGDSRLARLHGLWGLGQVAAKDAARVWDLASLLGDADAEVRAHAARLAGDLGRAEVSVQLTPLLADESPRVRYFAAQSLGKLRATAALPAILKLLAENADRDRYLRHAGVIALDRLATAEQVGALVEHPAPAVRLAAILVLRRRNDPQLAKFLLDVEPLVVLEAARAIHDRGVDAALPAVADLLPRVVGLADEERWLPLVRRALHANFRLGEARHAERIAAFAADRRPHERLRLEALAMLGEWERPGPRDRVTGFWRPLPPREAAIAAAALPRHIATLLGADSAAVAAEAARLATRWKISVDDALFADWVRDAGREPATRIAALNYLVARDKAPAAAALDAALACDVPALRAAARDLLAARDKGRALASYERALHDGALVERQAALLGLARLADAAADRLLERVAVDWLGGDLPRELHLEMLEAARQRKAAHPPLAERLAAYDASLPAGDPLAAAQVALLGGDAEAGRRIFTSHAQAQCIRCHRAGGEGGTAGPDLAKVATRGDRAYLLESLLAPSAKIAPGFGAVTLTLADGRLLTGVIQSEDASTVVLVTPQGERRAIAVAEIESRSQVTSPMPPAGPHLTLREVRDLLAFLSTLK